MTGKPRTAPPALPRIGRVTLSDLLAAFLAGWYDFRAMPQFGLVFSAIYALGGLALVWLRGGTLAWVLTLGFGFPLLAPFAALGLYEVSRLREAGRTPRWLALAAIFASPRRVLRLVGFAVLLACGFAVWQLGARAIFLALIGEAATRPGGATWPELASWTGMALVVAELVFGGTVAFLLYGAFVVSLPLCLDRDSSVPFFAALRLSRSVVRQNRLVMSLWAWVLALALLVGILPAFLGLFVVLPVLGHASWHLYRRALYQEV